METLPINIQSFGFVNRERNSSGNIVSYRCGRDFLYYALHYYYPERFSPSTNNPFELEKSHLLGLPLPWWLMWTQLQFIYMPRLLQELHLQLIINNKVITNFFDLILAMAIPRNSNPDQKIKNIEDNIRLGYASGIDISLGLGGLVDHVLFVYGHDADNLYVCDTHQVPKLEYEKLTPDTKYFMKLPKAVVKARWSRFGRAWTIRKIAV